MKRLLRSIVGIIIAVYVIGCIVLYFVQDDLIFRPTPLDPNTSYRWGEEVYIPVSGDLNLHGLYQSQVDAEGAILYLHGNRGNTRWCQRQAETFDGYGQNVLLLDYRGYGKSEGEVSNLEQLHDDIIKAYKWLVNKNPGLPITVAGYSLGSGMASYLAAHEEVEHLLLIAPYTSILDMKDQILPIIPDFLLKYPLSNEDYIDDISCPIAIFHGTEDEVIPYHHGVELAESAPHKIQLYTLQGTSHRRAIFHSEIRAYLDKTF